MTRVVAWLIVALIPAACGDPGTGGSGVPGTTAPAASTPATDSSTGSSLIAQIAQGQSSRHGAVEAVVAGAGSQALVQFTVSGVRYQLNEASTLTADDQPRSAGDLKVGVPVTVSFASDADLASAAINAVGPPVPAIAVVLSSPASGDLVGDASTRQVRFDGGATVAVSPTAAVSGTAQVGNRVRAWVLALPGTTNQVTRYEFE